MDASLHKKSGYFDHDADIGIIGWGQTIEEAFIAAAESVFAIMADLTCVKDDLSVAITFEESDIEFALVTWLNLLLTESHCLGWIFSRFELKKENSCWRARAWGEAWRDGISRGVEVKGATLTMLSVTQRADIWEARCVVDV